MKWTFLPISKQCMSKVFSYNKDPFFGRSRKWWKINQRKALSWGFQSSHVLWWKLWCAKIRRTGSLPGAVSRVSNISLVDVGCKLTVVYCKKWGYSTNMIMFILYCSIFGSFSYGSVEWPSWCVWNALVYHQSCLMKTERFSCSHVALCSVVISDYSHSGHVLMTTTTGYVPSAMLGRTPLLVYDQGHHHFKSGLKRIAELV